MTDRYDAPLESMAYANSNNVNTNANKFKKQTLSVFSPILIFMSGGMNLALSLGWNTGTTIPTTIDFQVSWFIGVIIGLIIAAPLIALCKKIFFYLIGGVFILIDGILFTSAPDNANAILAARYIDGFGVGFITVAFIVHFSEIMPKHERGTLMTLEQYSISFGILMQVIFSALAADNFPRNRVHGICGIIFGVLSLVTLPLVMESPIFYLRKDDETAAITQLRHFSKPYIMTREKEAQMAEMKQYVQATEILSFSSSFAEGLGPLLRMAILRSLVAVTFSLPLSGAIEISSLISQGADNIWPAYVFCFVRLIGGLPSIVLVDLVGRKVVSLVSLIIMAGLMIGLGVIFEDLFNIADVSQMTAAVGLACASQFFAAVFTPSTTVYLGEAFPLLIKPYFIAFCCLLEQVVHIIVVCTFEFMPYSVFCYFISVAVISIVFALLFFVTLPETKKITLLEAQERFKQWLHIGCR